jgi:hypothetical protein
VATIYRTTGDSGNPSFGDFASTRADGEVAMRKADGRYQTVEQIQPEATSHSQIKDAIKAAQKHIPKLHDYWQYLEYLHRYYPSRLNQVMQQLKQQDVQTWLTLQKHSMFRPITDTMFGLKTGEKNMAVGLQLATGNITGSIEKWLDGPVKEMMKRDRFGPYADVLGSKASTLAPPRPEYYSNTRFGEFRKADDVRTAKAAADAAKGLEESRAAVRSAKAVPVLRLGGTVLDGMLGALNTESLSGISAIQAMQLGRELVDKGVITPEEALELRGLMASGRFDVARQLIEAGRVRASGR